MYSFDSARNWYISSAGLLLMYFDEVAFPKEEINSNVKESFHF